MNTYDVNIKYYRTPIFETEVEAWRDLTKYINSEIDNHWVWFRTLPEVISEKNYPENKTYHYGFARFVVNPKEVLEDRDSITIPSLGTAKEKL